MENFKPRQSLCAQVAAHTSKPASFFLLSHNDLNAHAARRCLARLSRILHRKMQNLSSINFFSTRTAFFGIFYIDRDKKRSKVFSIGGRPAPIAACLDNEFDNFLKMRSTCNLDKVKGALDCDTLAREKGICKQTALHNACDV